MKVTDSEVVAHLAKRLKASGDDVPETLAEEIVAATREMTKGEARKVLPRSAAKPAKPQPG